MDSRARELEQLYRDRYVAFRNGVAAFTGSYESAPDVVQEAFAQALRDRRQYRGDGPLAGWVWRIAVRTALAARRNGHEVTLDEVAERAPAPPAAESDPALLAALRGLPERRRLIVYLRYFADLSYAEIAAACQISEGTVAASLSQARGELQRALEVKPSRETCDG
jgi:RNA polymerase sigma factor (sigma-70 family)